MFIYFNTFTVWTEFLHTVYNWRLATPPSVTTATLSGWRRGRIMWGHLSLSLSLSAEWSRLCSRELVHHISAVLHSSVLQSRHGRKLCVHVKMGCGNSSATSTTAGGEWVCVCVAHLRARCFLSMEVSCCGF